VSNLLGRIFGPGSQSDQSYGNSFANLQANPMFNVGLNLLSGGNWAEMVQQGLLQTDKYKDYMRAKTLAEEEEGRRRRLREAYPAALDSFFPGRVVGGMEMSPQPQPSAVVPGTEIVDMGPPTPPVVQQDPRRAIFEAAGPEKGMESLLGVIAPTSGDPSAVREWKYFSQLSEPEQEQFLNMKRSNLFNFGGSTFNKGLAPGSSTLVEVDPTSFRNQQTLLGETSAERKSQEKTAEAKVELSFAGALAAAKASGLEWGKSKAQAQIALPGARIAAQQFNKQIDIVMKHPGFSMAVGASSYAPQLRGSDANNFNAELKKLGGKIFGQAYQTLKGGGQITEIEAEKAEQAYANLDVGMSEDAFRDQLLDLKTIISDGLMKLEAEAGRRSELDALEDKYGSK